LNRLIELRNRDSIDEILDTIDKIDSVINENMMLKLFNNNIMDEESEYSVEKKMI
jgi:hypothetical protein